MTSPPALGKTIQKLRKDKALSLDVLAERSRVSKAMLSQIEKNKVNPTIGLLWKIAEGLHVPLQELLALERPHTHFEIKDRDNSPTLSTEDGKCVLQIISPPKMIESIELYLLHFEPGGRLESAPHFPHTEEIATAVQGRIKVVSGDESGVIEPFQSVHYSADMPHAIVNESGRARAVVYLAVRYQRG
jgi:transcriptional regulator with XRE-family HTH domain